MDTDPPAARAATPSAPDLDPFNPHIVARAGIHGVCPVHRAERPCRHCIATAAPRARKAGAA